MPTAPTEAPNVEGARIITPNQEGQEDATEQPQQTSDEEVRIQGKLTPPEGTGDIQGLAPDVSGIREEDLGGTKADQVEAAGA